MNKYLLVLVTLFLVSCHKQSSVQQEPITFLCVTPLGTVSGTDGNDVKITLKDGIVKFESEEKTVYTPFSNCIALQGK